MSENKKCVRCGGTMTVHKGGRALRRSAQCPDCGLYYSFELKDSKSGNLFDLREAILTRSMWRDDPFNV